MSSSSSSTGAPHPNREQKKPKPEAEAGPILSLTDNTLLLCFAPVPRSQHLELSLLSKSFGPLLSSPLLFEARSSLGCTEHLHYFTTCTLGEGLQWFALYRNPNVVVRVPAIHLRSALVDALYAVVGHNIYVIGGFIDNIPSRKVWVLDCRALDYGPVSCRPPDCSFYEWKSGPEMNVSLKDAIANVVNGKIYVIGVCQAESEERISVEVLDPAVGRWVKGVPCPFRVKDLGCRWAQASVVVGDKIYVTGVKYHMTLDTLNMEWKRFESGEEFYSVREGSIVVDGILYSCYSPGKIKFFDVTQREWKELKGLEEDLPRYLGIRATLADAGGKLLVLWSCVQDEKKETEIWCAEIEVNKNADAVLWGKVCWSKKILSLPPVSMVVQCSAVVL